MHSLYQMPIIPQNLRREETIVQISDALRYLSEAADDIFNRVNNRIEFNNNQLFNLNNRIDAAHLKVSKLKGTKKATQVFSSSKYPAIDVCRDYKSLFDEDNKLQFVRTKVKYKDVHVKNEPLEPLQFYHVKIGEIDEGQSMNGLGEIPKDIQCINDLLLYSNSKNPYKNYVISDPLQTSFASKKNYDALGMSNIGAAPISISDKTTLAKSTTDFNFYSPDLGDVPTIDVPLDLPDLPGIADDLRYVNEQGPGIAPSVLTPNIPELPILIESESNNIDKIETLIVPPPPPLPVKEEVLINEDYVEKSEPNLISVPKSEVQLEVIDETNHSLTKSSVNIDDMHANLMEAIRKAGGLKNANLKAATPAKTVSSGDLMADLHAKLSLRRKGISGSRNSDSTSGFDSGFAMNKVSAMIPPPSTKNKQTESTNTDDEEWD